MWRRFGLSLASTVLVFSLFAWDANGNSLSRGARDVVAGTLVDGPKHTWSAIRARPLHYAGMLGLLGVAGAYAKMRGIDPEPYDIGLSAGVYGWQAWKAWPQLKLTRGRARLRFIGAHYVWPFALTSGTAVLGSQIHHDHAHHHQLLKAAGQTAVITSDIPTLVTHGMGHDPAPRRFPRSP